MPELLQLASAMEMQCVNNGPISVGSDSRDDIDPDGSEATRLKKLALARKSKRLVFFNSSDGVKLRFVCCIGR